MSNISILKDAPFLHQLDKEKVKVVYVKILVLDKQEIPIRSIEGRISSGSISINGDSNVRRAGTLTFVAKGEENDLVDIDNLLSMNKKVKISIGIENHINKEYDDIIWFKLGIFVITQPSLQHTTSGVTISLQLKDKMCLLNGECGGNLPTSVTFHQYDQIIGLDDNDKRGYINYPANPNNYTVYLINGNYMMWDSIKGWSGEGNTLLSEVGKIVSIPQRFFDIIQTLVCNFGNESISKIIINGVPLEIKAIVRYIGENTLYYNTETGIYTQDENMTVRSEGTWKTFKYNEDCGYVYTDFTFPGELISGIGENICSVLDKIVSELGNYEYFYDIDGNFVFQEKVNYLNTSYDPILKLDKDGFLLNSENYYVDFNNFQKSIYTFEEGSGLITSYSNSPNYMNIKNDYHIWGKNNDNLSIHYHIAVKEKPLQPFGVYNVVDNLDSDGNYTGKIHIAQVGEKGYEYQPEDWRAAIYMQGLEKKSLHQRPDIYEQELLDFWDSIYNMKEKKFKVDITNYPNDLKYWLDYIQPANLFDISVDTIGTKMFSVQKDQINKLYSTDVPNIVMINASSTSSEQASLMGKCEAIGQPYARVPQTIYENVAIGTVGYTAQETARELLYQYTDYNESISITSIPIYYLDVNERITVQDRASNIFGDYIVRSINLPLDASGTMSIQASKALQRF